jgi:FKBP-type peptidyl-prolyl cis-trans isomerase
MLTVDGGVQKKILDQGVEGNRPQKGDKIHAHYIGKLVDGTVFDTSQSRGKPIEVEIGVGRVVQGWDIAIQTMNLGEVAGLIVTQEYGYGSRGKEGMVPPDSTMLFLV